MSVPLPLGFRVRLVDDTVALEGGAVLVGGSPLTSLRISEPARALRHVHLTVTDRASARIADRLLGTNLALPDLATTTAPVPQELTIVVPVRDRPEQLARCLGSMAGLACIVVDDASAEPHAVADVARKSGAKLIVLDQNVGPAAARNAGLALVNTPFVAFVDSDVEVTSEALLAMLRHFADPAVALVGPRILGRTRRARPRWFERYEARDSSLTLGTRAGCVRPGAGVAWLPSACLVGRVCALEVGFDARMRVGEDVDLVWRLTDQGHRVRYDPGIGAHHDTRATMWAWLGRKAFYGSGSAALASRHGNRVAPAVLSPAYALAGTAVLCRHPSAFPLALWALLRGHRAVSSVLPPDRVAATLAARVATRGFAWALRQESALLLRHWWPATLAAALLSRHVRRAATSALVVDAAVVLWETEGLTLSDLPAHLVGRRLDDIAYGAGLWWGAMRSRRISALAPRWILPCKGLSPDPTGGDSQQCRLRPMAVVRSRARTAATYRFARWADHVPGRRPDHTISESTSTRKGSG